MFEATLRNIAQQVQRRLPRMLALGWALWCTATAVAYVEHVPPQLEAVDGALASPVWGLWAGAAVLLLLGSVVTSAAPPRVQNVARWLRITGMTITCATLIIWTVAFFMDEPRGWVTGKNYALLAIMAAVTTWTIARDEASRKRVVRP